MTEEIHSPELDREAILTPEDPRFSPDRVAVVTGAGSGIGRATATSARSRSRRPTSRRRWS